MTESATTAPLGPGDPVFTTSGSDGSDGNKPLIHVDDPMPVTCSPKTSGSAVVSQQDSFRNLTNKFKVIYEVTGNVTRLQSTGETVYFMSFFSNVACVLSALMYNAAVNTVSQRCGMSKGKVR